MLQHRLAFTSILRYMNKYYYIRKGVKVYGKEKNYQER